MTCLCCGDKKARGFVLKVPLCTDCLRMVEQYTKQILEAAAVEDARSKLN